MTAAPKFTDLGYLPRKLRHASFPVLAPVSTPVADVEDALAWPEINAAIDHARKLRKAQQIAALIDEARARRKGE